MDEPINLQVARDWLSKMRLQVRRQDSRKWCQFTITAVGLMVLLVARNGVTQEIDTGVTEQVEQIKASEEICDESLFSPGTWPLPRFSYYLKSGPSLTMGDSFFGSDAKGGWQISGGIREPLLPNKQGVFYDFGGSYLAAYGEGDTITVDGSVFNSPAEVATLTLRQISRAGVHSSIGWYLHDNAKPTADGGIIRSLSSFRIGGRLSHMHGHFRELPTQAAENAGGLESSLVERTEIINGNDTSWGGFLGFEYLFSRPMHNRGGTLSFLVDAELANDWVELSGFQKGRLPTASVLFGLSINR